jgi:phage tail sheath protein FI
LPFGSAVTAGGGRFDGLTGAPSNSEYSWVFTLDQICGAAPPYIHSSGSRRGNRSLTATSDDYTAVLTEGINRFWAPMYGGHDGLDVTESEPFRNSQWGATTTRLSDAHYNSVDRAIRTVEDAESVECNIITAPGITNTGLTDLIMDTCQNRADALAIIDIEDCFVPETENTQSYANRLGSVTSTVSSIQARDINNSYACTYYPWVQIKDTKESRLLHVPPSVIALGTFASSQATSELWFAPAGFTRGGLTNGAAGLPVTGVTERLTSKKRDDLYENNINPIAKFPAEGIVIFGQKTLQQTSSALDRINVRRLMIFVKKEISRIAATVLFDQNVSVTWGRFTGEVEPFLSDVRARLGLTDFKVVLDETTTTPDLVDRNIMYAKIFLKPARAIEYIAVDFVITRTGAAFED